MRIVCGNLLGRGREAARAGREKDWAEQGCSENSLSRWRANFGIIRPVRSAGFRDCAGRARDAEGSQRQRIAASTQRLPEI